MKKILLFALLITCQALYAQKPDSVQIDGAYYYVYPYPQKVYPTQSLLNTLTEKDRAALEAEDSEAWGDQIANFLYLGSDELGGPKMSKTQVQLMRQNAERSYTIYAENTRDLVPSLDELPDGKYIQYFQKYWKFDAQDKLVVEKNKVAGYFSLQNNLPEGNALWVNMVGDTVKAGKFSQGVKEGIWITSDFSSGDIYYGSRKLASDYLNKSNLLWTSKETYAHGVLNGPSQKWTGKTLASKGFYKDGEPSGEWFIYSQTEFVKNGKWVDTNYLSSHYMIPEKKGISHKPYIRTQFGNENLLSKYYKFPLYFEMTLISELWELNIEEDPDLELPEENMTSYEGEEYDEGGDYMEDYGDYGDEYGGDRSVWLKGKYIQKNKVVDSIGLINKYQLYEEFWENGKLKMRFEYKNGNLVLEDTIFWDNGKPADVIVYDPQKKQYEQKRTDYDGVLYQVDVFDSLGIFVKQTLDPLYKEKHILIDGVFAELKENYIFIGDESEDAIEWNTFLYEKEDTLRHPLSGQVVLSKSWYGDSTLQTYVVYNAEERVITEEIRSLNGTLMSSAVYEYDEKFDNVRGTSSQKLKGLELKKTFNGNYNPVYRLMESDSFPAMRTQSLFLYEMTEDQVLNYGNEPFTGKLVVNLNQKSSSYSVGKNKVTIGLASSTKHLRKLYKDYQKFVKTGKSKYKDALSATTSIDGEYYSSAALMVFPELSFMLAANKNDYQPNVIPMEPKKVEGSFLNGKPNGVWKTFDAKGKLIIECSYLNGTLEGSIKMYAYAKPKEKKPKGSEYEWDYTPETSVYDTLPAKSVYYMSSKIGVKNGILNGDLVSYDWQGKVKSKVNYVSGYPEGPASEHNAIASTYMNFENGAMDGIVKTYLHIPGRDSILLYELNFQDGALQGESRSYHTNGKLSKRGFFLNGQPIDDYEGYDSLGTRFHYIKFQYSFPVEEKIWESNQLSVRYLFDWRDSIYFMPDDITQATSVDNLLFQYGLMGNEYSQPYYGRPSLIEKTGINYHMTKYFPNDSISRDGALSAGKKTGCWQFYAYNGEKLYEVEYFDTIIRLNDSIQFKSKGMHYDFDKNGNLLSRSYIIEKFEKYDCSHTDHYEVRQFYTVWQAHDSLHRINGYVKNHYDNGVLQSEGNMKDGLPTGIWKYYDPFGKLNHVGEYKLGKRDGRWLSGDLSKSKYLGDICMNPNLPDLEEQMKYQEKMLDIYIRYFKNGKLLNSEYYDLNLNEFEDGSEETDEGEFEEER